MIKKYPNQLVLFFILMLFSTFWTIPGNALALCSIDPNGTYIEAEHFTGDYQLDEGYHWAGDYFESHPDNSANGEVVLKSGSSGVATNTPENEVKTYEVNFTATGTFYIWMRGKGFSGSEDSMFFTVDNDAWKAWNFGGDYGSFIWTDSMQVGSDNMINIDTTGSHTIKIAMREDNAEIDGFYITKGTETPTDATVPSGVTTINPQAGCNGPTWATDPLQLEPTCFVGYNAISLTFDITNTGTEDDTATATITSSETWATVDNSTVPALAINQSHTVTVNFNTSTLAAGTHTATLTITSNGGVENSPLEIPITLLIKTAPSSAACGEIPLYAENLVNPAIMVQLDTSGSMGNYMNTDDGYMTRIAIAEDVLKEMFLDRSISWGFATWAGGSGHSYDSDNAPDYYTTYRIGCHDHDDDHQDALQDKADDGSASGYTPLVPTMKAALAYFQGNREDDYYNETFTELSCQPRILVLVTDGQGNTATDNSKIDAITDSLIAEGITIVAVGFGLDDATQLDRIVQKMQTAGEASDDDYLYHLHNEDVNGDAEPFMAQNRQEFIDVMNQIVTGVKAQVFHGSSPAPTTSVDNGAILLNANFDASDWSGNLKATLFNAFTGELESTTTWETTNTVTTGNINAFIYDATEADHVSQYTEASISGDNYLCKAMGDIINSTPAIVEAPPYYYKFGNDNGEDLYYNFKYSPAVNNRDEMAYFGANDGALHAVRVSDGTEKWRFYPNSVISKMAQAETDPSKDPCSSSYCHQFLVDGTPEPADIYVNTTTKWRTILVTGLGKGGSAFFTLDVTYGKDFDDSTAPSLYLWEFNDTDDAELGYATSWPTTARLSNGTGTGWATVFSSGAAATDLLQADKEAYLFAVKSYNKSKVWIDENNDPVYKIKLSSSELKNDVPSSPHLVDIDDDAVYDRIYVGNLYGNLYRAQHIGFFQKPEIELLFNSENTDHATPVTAKACSGYNDGDIWIFFGTGRYQYQIDKISADQQYFYGLFDEGASKSTPYIKSDLVEMQTEIVEAYALDDNGDPVDLDEDGDVDADDLEQYRTVFCNSPDEEGRCNPDNKSWMLKLTVPSGSASERSISQPLIVGGVVFFTTFIPDGDVCAGNGDTYLFAVDWESGEFVSNAVFDLNGDNEYTEADQTVQDPNDPDSPKKVVGLYIGTGKPVPELVIHNDILFVGTTDDDPTVVKVNLGALQSRLRSWKRQFN
ncbi:PilC/PilY family type IV pilus protein [Desulfobacter curvatus]|uniref:PilC/PilY family type IV pilus protein n=1 Tax=Desulfobacter curvatus TaxID=2290 RepID=UPI0003785951|nr:PilC/PilY family type IV pilus protein [Desulfobacter curvatus]